MGLLPLTSESIALAIASWALSAKTALASEIQRFFVLVKFFCTHR